MNHQQMEEVVFPNSVEPTYEGIHCYKENKNKKKNNREHCCGKENWVGYGIVHEVTDACAVSHRATVNGKNGWC